MRLKNYVQGEWVEGTGPAVALHDAVTGAVVAEATTGGLDFKNVLEYARKTGSPSLRAMTVHQRARMLKALAQYMMSRKDERFRPKPMRVSGIMVLYLGW